MKTPEGKTKMDKQQVLNQLRNAKEIYVIMSLCTRMPYVVCDKETFDDEVLIYFTEEDVKREGKRLLKKRSRYRSQKWMRTRCSTSTETFTRWV